MDLYYQDQSRSSETPPPDIRSQVLTRRTPPPDIVPITTASSQSTHELAYANQFLVIGLFALRLTKQLIQGLEPYAGRDDDLTWLDNFLSYFSLDYPLARISGIMRTDYLQTYPLIISRMRKEARYPSEFMRLNPDKSTRDANFSHRGDTKSERWTDIGRINMIDFCDAAAEWGSVVPLPAQEAPRMIELADQRKVASFDHQR